MGHVVVVGAQWGDEGKGKVVDWLAERADVVVRFQGGHNAGHTLVIGGVTYKLSLLPSGIVRPGTVAMIGNGVVVDPWHLMEEIATLRAQGVAISPANLRLAETAPLILPLHRELDGLRESSNSGLRIGTTRRGIGPAYEDKVGRRAIRVADLRSPETLTGKIERLLAHHNLLRRGLGMDPIDPATLHAELAAIAEAILPYAAPVWHEIDLAVRAGKRLLFEGAQGALLDVDHGTYPFVTSSNILAGQAATGAGVGPRRLSHVLGIAKAYSTRVGEGPFPTELFDAVGERIGARGREFGVVTGRKRRCGWFDAVAVRQVVTLSGIDSLALMKLDVLDGLETLRIATAYRLGDRLLDRLPATAEELATVEPVYEEMPGWSGSTEGVRSLDALPAAARAYVERLSSLAGVPLALLSTGPERDDTIVIDDPFDAALGRG